jgi:hypothetical protein
MPPIVTGSSLGGAPLREIDPIFAAIEAYTKACEAHEERVSENGRLCRKIPKKRRQSYIHAREEEFFESDDPRWIASERAVASAYDAAEDAAIELLTVEPTTLAGASALLTYFGETERGGLGLVFPDSVDYRDDGEGITFHAALAFHVSETINRIGAV